MTRTIFGGAAVNGIYVNSYATGKLATIVTTGKQKYCPAGFWRVRERLNHRTAGVRQTRPFKAGNTLF